MTTVWLADDSATEARAAKAVLQPAHEVVLFEDGPSLIERAGRDPLPDAFVIDWIMPSLSGIEVCRHLSSHSRTAAIPILLLTSHRSTEDLVEGLSAGASDFVAKPFAPAELIARVASLVRAKRLRDRAEQADQSRAKLAVEQARLAELYLAVVGHDLRNPVAAISQIGALLARESVSDDDRRRLAARLVASTHRMSALIDRVLDVTRVRLGSGLRLQLEDCSVRELCEQAMQELALGHPGRAVELAGEGRGLGRWDRQRLLQVFSNLIGNALEHGARDRTVTVSIIDDETGTTVAVHNEGPAIPAERIAGIFDPFRQSDGRGFGGLGLGLYIADQVVRAHQGSIAVESGAGTTFTVRLPAARIR